jgi:hypothetical protein
MPAYLVRTIEEHDIVGFFAADEMEDLLIAVDECTDPSDCEYMELPVGGIMWSSPAIAIPLSRGDDADEESEAERLPWEKADLSDTWWNALYGYADDNWTEFFPNNPRSPRPAAPPHGIGPAQVVPIRKSRT